jgi:hypothetical protein
MEKAILFGGDLTRKTANEVSDEVWVFDPAINEWGGVMRP